MATGKRYYWIKLKASFLTSDAVDFLMGQPDGANYVVLYQMLCLKTINTDGKLERKIGEIIIPYDEAKIQRDCKWFPIDTVRVALNLYKQLGLIYRDENGTLRLADYENIVGSETDWKDQKRDQRKKNLQKLGTCKRMNASTIMLPSGKKQFVDEKRYGGNGMLAFDLAGGLCEMCGDDTDLVIHHANGYSNNIDDLYVLCKRCHGIAHSAETSREWLKHNRTANSEKPGVVGCGQGGGQVHTEIEYRDRDKRKSKEIEKDIYHSEEKIAGADNINADLRFDETCSDRDPAVAASADFGKEFAKKLISAWNESGGPKVKGFLFNSVRGENYLTLLRAYGAETLLAAVEKVKNSKFLHGVNDRGWVATFDWFLRPDNFAKVLEGNYDEQFSPGPGGDGDRSGGSAGACKAKAGGTRGSAEPTERERRAQRRQAAREHFPEIRGADLDGDG